MNKLKLFLHETLFRLHDPTFCLWRITLSALSNGATTQNLPVCSPRYPFDAEGEAGKLLIFRSLVLPDLESNAEPTPLELYPLGHLGG